MRFKGLVGLCAGVCFALGGIAQATTLTISITNNTAGHSFQELLIVAHGVQHHLFNSGYPATLALETLAECGDQAPLAAEMSSEDPRADVWGGQAFPIIPVQLGPGETVEIGPLLVTDAANTRLSIVGRMMATNDGFVGLESEPIPSVPGTYPSLYMLAFDAGTEPNNELLSQSADPVCSLNDANMADRLADLWPDDNYLGVNGTGAAAQESGLNTSITIHRGVLGDAYPGGGVSDLDYIHHRWKNTDDEHVATVTVIVQ